MIDHSLVKQPSPVSADNGGVLLKSVDPGPWRGLAQSGDFGSAVIYFRCTALIPQYFPPGV